MPLGFKTEFKNMTFDPRLEVSHQRGFLNLNLMGDILSSFQAETSRLNLTEVSPVASKLSPGICSLSLLFTCSESQYRPEGECLLVTRVHAFHIDNPSLAPPPPFPAPFPPHPTYILQSGTR